MIDLDALLAIFSIISAVVGVSAFFLGRKSANVKEGEEAGAMKTDLVYIKDGVKRIECRLDDSIARMDGRIDQLAFQFSDVAKTAAAAEKTAKSAHRRVDDHLRREHGVVVETKDEDE